MVFLATKRDMLFQSTLPRGSDSSVCFYARSRRHFNPRSLAGATYPYDRVIIVDNISIHAPSRERLTADYTSAKQSNISIHAPSRERPVWYNIYKQQRAISIHAPSRERHGVWALERNQQDISIHAPSRERLYCIYDRKGELIFQSTLPRGSDLRSY